MAKHGSLVNIPKWFKMVEMVNLYVFDHLGPFWAHMNTFGPFQTKIKLLPHKDKVRFYRGAFEQKIIFLFEMVQKGPDGPKIGPKWPKTIRLTILDPFGPLWTTLEC